MSAAQQRDLTTRLETAAAKQAAIPGDRAPTNDDDGPGSPQATILVVTPAAPRPRPAKDAQATTAAGTEPVGKKSNSALLASYTASARPPTLASPDPCLACMKRLDKSPGNGCPKVPHNACTRCIKAKRKCEPVPFRFRALGRRTQRAATRVVAARTEEEETPDRPRAARRAAMKKRFYAERDLRYRHTVFCHRVEAWQRKEAAARLEEQAQRTRESIHKYLKVLARSHYALTKTPMPPDSDEEAVDEEWADPFDSPVVSDAEESDDDADDNNDDAAVETPGGGDGESPV